MQLKCKLTIWKSTSADDSDSEPEDDDSGFCEDVEKLWPEKFVTDFNLRCADELFPCHKFVLACRSTVFKTMLSNKAFMENVTNEAEIKDFSPKSVKDFLEFLYTDYVTGRTGFNSVELLFMADKYNVGRLKKYCQSVLSRSVDSSNAIKLFRMASTIEAAYLMKKTAEFILKNINKLFDTAEWKEMVESNPEHMNNIFKFRRQI